MASHHAHPNPTLDRITQYGAWALMIVMVLAGFGQIVLAASGYPMLLITGFITLLLNLPVIMLTTATPAITITADGITIEPVIWRSRSAAWSDIAAVKPYTLLPPPDSEIGRKALTGRKRYRPAEGIMLTIPSLPLQYRVTGFFAGEGFTGVIAFTNRTHTDYPQLVKLIKDARS